MYTDRELALYDDLQSAVRNGMELRHGLQTHERSLDAPLPHKCVPPPMTAATEAAYRWLTRQEDVLVDRPEVNEVSWTINDGHRYFEEMAQLSRGSSSRRVFGCQATRLEGRPSPRPSDVPFRFDGVSTYMNADSPAVSARNMSRNLVNHV